MATWYRTAADRLCTGSGILARRFGTWLMGERLRDVLIRPVGAVAALTYSVTVLMPATPASGLLATAGWCAAAWRAARAVERYEAAQEALLQLLDDCIADRNGVLLADVLLVLHRSELLLDEDAASLRRHCEAAGVVVRDSLKVDGRVSTGVHREDLDAVLAPPPPLSSTPPPEESPQVSDPNYLREGHAESGGGAGTTVYSGHGHFVPVREVTKA